MKKSKSKIEFLEQRIQQLEEENNALADRVEDMLLLKLINDSFETIADEEILLRSVLEQISVLKNIPYSACFQISPNSSKCLVQYCSLINREPNDGLITFSQELINQLHDQSVIRFKCKENPTLINLHQLENGFIPSELVAFTFHSRSISKGFFVFISEENPVSPFSKDLQSFHQSIKIIVDKWDRLALMRELKDLNHELENKVDERTLQFRQSEEKYRQLFNLANDAIFLWSIDSNNQINNCIQLNDSATTLTGLTRENAKSMTPSLLLDSAYSVQEKLHYESLFKEPGTIFRASFKTPKGVLPLEFHSRRFNIAGQELVLAIARDISKQLAFESEIIEAKNKAVESEQLKTAFLANMSHEIRTPMNAIVGFSELLGQDAVSDNEVKMYADIIFKNSMHLLSLINDIVDYSKIEAKQLKIYKHSVNINELIEDLSMNMISILHKTSKGAIDVLTHTPLVEERANILTDGTRLRQVLSNLINNAIKFTNSGFIEVGYKKLNDKELEFFVKDTGIGIAPENQKKIFDRFVQVRDMETFSQGGTGLGLTICANIVERLNGQLCLESEPGKGSTFLFTIPYIKC
ncbi:MAG: ATP-binding protein [Carboxylicivirga sp.]|jgi:PAS domain S-box-containing protein|nr:ATP-binding protein [Carboxylicivirga sp.]